MQGPRLQRPTSGPSGPPPKRQKTQNPGNNPLARNPKVTAHQLVDPALFTDPSRCSTLSDSVLCADVHSLQYESGCTTLSCRTAPVSRLTRVSFRVVFSGALGDAVQLALEEKKGAWSPLPAEARLLLRGAVYQYEGGSGSGSGGDAAFTLKYESGAFFDLLQKPIASVEDISTLPPFQVYSPVVDTIDPRVLSAPPSRIQHNSSHPTHNPNPNAITTPRSKPSSGSSSSSHLHKSTSLSPLPPTPPQQQHRTSSSSEPPARVVAVPVPMELDTAPTQAKTVFFREPLPPKTSPKLVAETNNSASSSSSSTKQKRNDLKSILQNDAHAASGYSAGSSGHRNGRAMFASSHTSHPNQTTRTRPAPVRKPADSIPTTAKASTGTVPPPNRQSRPNPQTHAKSSIASSSSTDAKRQNSSMMQHAEISPAASAPRTSSEGTGRLKQRRGPGARRRRKNGHSVSTSMEDSSPNPNPVQPPQGTTTAAPPAPLAIPPQSIPPPLSTYVPPSAASGSTAQPNPGHPTPSPAAVPPVPVPVPPAPQVSEPDEIVEFGPSTSSRSGYPADAPKLNSEPPTDYYKISDFPLRGKYDMPMIGIVVTVDPVTDGTQGDWRQTISLRDASNLGDSSSFQFTLFADKEEKTWLPGDLKMGHVLLIRGLKHKNRFSTEPSGFKHKWIWAAYDPSQASDEEAFYTAASGSSSTTQCTRSPCTECERNRYYAPKKYSPVHDLRPDEREYMMVLGEWWRRVQDSKAKIDLPAPKKAKVRLIKEVGGLTPSETVFGNVLVEIVAMPAPGTIDDEENSRVIDIWVTDYTVNHHLLYTQPLQFEKRHLLGRDVAMELARKNMLLPIGFFNEFVERTDKLQCGRFYRLRNLAFIADAGKFSHLKGRVRNFNGLEDKDVVRVLESCTDRDMVDLLQRRREYWANPNRERKVEYVLEGPKEVLTRKEEPKKSFFPPPQQPPSGPSREAPPPPVTTDTPVAGTRVPAETRTDSAPSSSIEQSVSAAAAKPAYRPGHRPSFLDEPPVQSPPRPRTPPPADDDDAYLDPELFSPKKPEPPPAPLPEVPVTLPAVATEDAVEPSQVDENAPPQSQSQPESQDLPVHVAENSKWRHTKVEIKVLPDFESVPLAIGISQMEAELSKLPLPAPGIKIDTTKSVSFRFEAKIVDHHPKDPKRFVVFICTECGKQVDRPPRDPKNDEHQPRGEPICAVHPKAPTARKWMFQLRFKDRMGNDTIAVVIDPYATQFLNRNPPDVSDPAILRNVVGTQWLPALMGSGFHTFCVMSALVNLASEPKHAWHLLGTTANITNPDDPRVFERLEQQRLGGRF